MQRIKDQTGRLLTLAARQRLAVLVIPMALLVSSGLVYRASTAAFTSSTQNAGNSWQAGSVSLADDDSGTAMFSATGLTPGSTGQRCLVVSYTGDVPSTVALYGTATGTLAQYLDLTVETGTGGTFAAGSPCSTFTPSATIYSGTLAGFASTHTDFASGLPSTARWAPSTSSDTRVYRFSYSVQDNPLAEGTSAGADFTWEAQST